MTRIDTTYASSREQAESIAEFIRMTAKMLESLNGPAGVVPEFGNLLGFEVKAVRNPEAETGGLLDPTLYN
jgi:hypothetical protein